MAGAEFYVSDVYRQMLVDGGRVTANRTCDGHETIVLGTPEEYEACSRPAA